MGCNLREASAGVLRTTRSPTRPRLRSVERQKAQSRQHSTQTSSETPLRDANPVRRRASSSTSRSEPGRFAIEPGSPRQAPRHLHPCRMWRRASHHPRPRVNRSGVIQRTLAQASIPSLGSTARLSCRCGPSSRTCLRRRTPSRCRSRRRSWRTRGRRRCLCRAGWCTRRYR